MGELALADFELARRRVRPSDASVANMVVVHQVLKVKPVTLRYLYYYAGIFGHEHLHNVLAVELVEAYVESAVGVGEAHFQQSGNHSARADVMTGHEPAVLHKLLKRVEGVTEVVGVLHRGHVVAHLAERLGESRAAEAQLVVREIYVVKP